MLVDDIYNTFIDKFIDKDFNESGLLEILGASFIADKEAIFGSPNKDYIAKELAWYRSKSRNVFDMHNPPKVWIDVADKEGYINSNYGWCIYSEQNYNQYYKVLKTLRKNPNSRQGTMIYTRPTMHEDSSENGRYDFICTNAVTYNIRNGELHCIVQMRSNDAIFGYKNDYAWQKYVLDKLAEDLGVKSGNIHWQVASLHIYPRHFYLIEQIINELGLI